MGTEGQRACHRQGIGSLLAFLAHPCLLPEHNKSNVHGHNTFILNEAPGEAVQMVEALLLDDVLLTRQGSSHVANHLLALGPRL